MSIRLKLTLWYSLILAFTLLVFGVSFYLLLSTLTTNQQKQSLFEQAEKVTQRIDFGRTLSLRGIDLNIRLDAVDHNLSQKVYLQVINLTTSPSEVQRSDNAVNDQVQIPLTETAQQAVIHGRTDFETIKMQGHEFIIYHRPIVYYGQVVGILQAATFTGDLVSNFYALFIPSAVITIILAFLFGWFLARKALKPIENVITATSQIQRGDDLDKRIPYSGPQDEIGRLTSTINSMLGRLHSTYQELEDLYRGQRRFVSDASHELRTPLTTIRGNIDLLEKIWTKKEVDTEDSKLSKEELNEMARDAMADIITESHRMSRLVNDMLSLARADAGYVVDKTWVPVKPLVEEVARKAAFLPRRAEWIVDDLSVLEHMEVWGHEDYLQQLLFIFIENAFKYTEAGSVRLSSTLSDEQVGIQIEDTGMGMDEEEIPHIFDRFYRADVSRGKTAGTGLGLSIAKWIIDEHKGSVEVITRQGAGTTFMIWLPAKKVIRGILEETKGRDIDESH